MDKIHIATNRLIISTMDTNSLENVTQMFLDYNNNALATGVFSEISEETLIKRIYFDKSVDSGFNVTANIKESKVFVGYLKGYITDENGVWVYIFMIMHQLRKKGYGTEFFTAIETFLHNKYNLKYIKLSVLSNNVVALSFWESLGFKTAQIVTKQSAYNYKASKINIIVKYF